MKKPKCAPADFTAENLPANRVEVFFDCIKIRFFTLLGLGAVLLLFALPAIGSVLGADFVKLEIYSLAANGVIEESAVDGTVGTVNMILNFALILCLGLYGVGLAGAVNVIKQLVWGEGVIFSDDFRLGMRQSGLRYALIFMFAGAVNFVDSFVYSTQLPVIIKALPYSFTVIILLPTMVLEILLDGVYKFTFLESVKAAFMMYVRTLPKTLLAVAIAVSPILLLLLIPNVILKSALIALGVLVLSPLLVVGIFLYGMSLCDKFINRERFPAIVDKGVHRKGEREKPDENKDSR